MTRYNGRIVAAIPNYNMGKHASVLVKLLLKQRYDHIYVFDDCSTDNSLSILGEIRDDRYTLVPGIKNVGAGAVRNKILDYEHSGYVHFLDADVIPQDLSMPQEIAKAFDRHKDAGVVGFRVKNPDGSQYQQNYGPLITSPLFISSVPYTKLSKKWPRVFSPRKRSPWNTIPLEDAIREQRVGAVVECNMAVRIEDFKEAGGFAENLRFHEIHHLVLNLRKMHKSVWYVPKNTVLKHDYEDVRPARRKEQVNSAKQIIKNKLMGKYR